ncbi:MAG: hypothetical protein PHX41_15640, partial [Kiritimatiellae bacterium]|nr:hypothetical protein [Kiritimatiellia bacterium]
MKIRLCVVCVFAVSVFHTCAETVALWKLDYDADGSALNTRCLLEPAHDLLPSGTFAAGAAA